MTQFDPKIAAEVFPLSPAQALAYQHHADEAVLLVRWDMRGDAPSHRVEKALNDVIARHEILRTVFVRQGADLEQIALPVADLKLDTVDLRALPIDDHGDRIDTIAQKIAAEPFDLESAPLMRAALVRTAPQRAALLIAAHRAVADEASADVLAHDLAAALLALQTGQPPAWPRLELHYADYALWTEACLQDPSHDLDRAFWKETLSGLCPTRLSGDGPGSEARTERLHLPLPPRFGKRLAQGAEARGCDVDALVLAAVSAVVSRIVHSNEVVIVHDDEARSDDALSPLIGAFARPLPLRITTPTTAPLGHHLTHVAEALTAARAHGFIPSVTPGGEIDPRAAISCAAFSDVGVALRTGGEARIEAGCVALERDLPAPQRHGRTLQITLGKTASGHSILLDYDASRLSQARVTALGQDLHETLEHFINASADDEIALLGTADSAPGATRTEKPERPTWTIAPMRDGTPESPVIVTVNQPHLYRNFAMDLDGDISVVNLAVIDGAALTRQMEMGYDALVDEAVTELVAAFRGRPLCVIGQCVDGLSAMHIARRCEAQGADLCLAVLIDAWAPLLQATEQSPIARRLERISHSRKRNTYYLRQVLTGRMSMRMLMLRNRVGRKLLRLFGGDVATADGADLLLAVNAYHADVANRVPFPGWDGEVITFASDSQGHHKLDTLFDWQGLIRRDTPIYRVAGWHEDALQFASHAEIAEIVEARLESILAKRKT